MRNQRWRRSRPSVRRLAMGLSVAVMLVGAGAAMADAGAANPVIWADVPDIAMIRVGDTYYMSSTTMHMSPGLPIMKSKDLVNWELVGYAYETLADNEALRLENGRNAYGAGSWASSLRYHDGTFYASTFSSTTGKTHIYTTKNIETGPWSEVSFSPSLHDHTLFFDDDGRVFMIYGVGDIRLIELAADARTIKPGGMNRVIIPNASLVAGGRVGLPAEGSQMIKVDGQYYLFNITWPRGDMRTQIVHRADAITGPYEGRVVLRDRGVAQGSVIDTPDGRWYAYLFQDHGAVGRVPFLLPVRWEDGWPVLGADGKVPMTLDIPAGKEGLSNIVASDDFHRRPGDPDFPLAWQWNHNPDHAYWSLTERPGWLRLTTGRVDADLLSARNTLTQRTFGPQCSGRVALDVSNLKDGDVAGLGALQKRYGFVGVKRTGDDRSLVMVSAETDIPVEVESVPLGDTTVFLRLDCDYRDRADRASFYYSLDGENWTGIGSLLKMSYTLPHFMGYRFALFHFSTKNAGGYVDFDHFQVRESPRANAPFPSPKIP
jgi:beta-xylosidase